MSREKMRIHLELPEDDQATRDWVKEHGLEVKEVKKTGQGFMYLIVGREINMLQMLFNFYAESYPCAKKDMPMSMIDEIWDLVVEHVRDEYPGRYPVEDWRGELGDILLA